VFSRYVKWVFAYQVYREPHYFTKLVLPIKLIIILPRNVMNLSTSFALKRFKEKPISLAYFAMF